MIGKGSQRNSPSRVFAETLRRVRIARELSQRQLAELVAMAGTTLDPATIARIESGKRGITLDEAFIFAAVLNIAPPMMFSPPPDDEMPVHVTDQYIVDAYDVVRWIAGDQPLPTSSPGWANHREWAQSVRPLRLIARQRDRIEDVATAYRQCEFAERHEDDPQAKLNAHRLREEALIALADVVRELMELGVPPTRLPGEWVRAMDRLGLLRGPAGSPPIEPQQLIEVEA